MHLAGNMLFLWVFGDNMEDQMGHLGFFGFYTLGGLAAAYAQVVSDPFSHVPHGTLLVRSCEHYFWGILYRLNKIYSC